MTSWAKAYRLPETLAAVAVLCALILAAGTRTLRIASQTPIPAVWFLALGLVVAAALPLNSPLGVLEQTFARTPTLRSLRAAAVALAVGLGGACLAVANPAHAVVTWLLLLAAATVLATLLLGQHAIFVTLTLGAGSIYAEHWLVNTPITRLATFVGLPLAAACLGASLLLFTAAPGAQTRTTS